MTKATTMSTVFPPNPPILAAVAGEAAAFPVGRIYCVGRNYAAHAREMGSDPTREPPFFFAKFPDAIAQDGTAIPYPPATRDLHHEVELVVALGAGGFDVPAADAASLIFGYAVGLDLTRRDLQAEAKKHGRPWSTGKNFPLSAPLGAIARAEQVHGLEDAAITLAVNTEIRQQGRISDMIWSVPETIAALSKLYRLQPGDLIFTGTPDGVGPVVEGDVLAAAIDGLPRLAVRIGALRP
jgi:fumarylpyruvate hydrolase